MMVSILWLGCVAAVLAFSSAPAQERKLEPLIVSYSSLTGNRAPYGSPRKPPSMKNTVST